MWQTSPEEKKECPSLGDQKLYKFVVNSDILNREALLLLFISMFVVLIWKKGLQYLDNTGPRQGYNFVLSSKAWKRDNKQHPGLH